MSCVAVRGFAFALICAILSIVSSPFEIFRRELSHVAGGALARLRYVLQDDPIQMRGGLYRFVRPTAADEQSVVDVQLLFYSGGPSRFDVKLWRTTAPKEKVRLGVRLRERGLATRCDESGWWEFVSGDELTGVLQDAVRGLEQVLDAEDSR